MNQPTPKKEHVNVAVIGTSGHASSELIKLLTAHPHATITALVTGNSQNAGKRIAEVRQELDGVVDLSCEQLTSKEIASKCDIAISSTPVEASLQYIPGIISSGKKCIDLSGAYRFANPNTFEEHYGICHTDPDNLSRAVYGLPELFREKVRQAKLVANPGCYPTAMGLSIAPALREGVVDVTHPVIVRAISGYSGAGVNYQPISGVRPYKIAAHKHTPEMAQVCNDYFLQCHGELGDMQVSFAPRINDDVPRGIDSDVSMLLASDIDQDTLRTVYTSFYSSEPLVDVLDKEPDVRDVTESNGAQVSAWKEVGLLHAISVIDNLRKGAASQAIQNLNLMCGFDEMDGLVTNH
jgi:N-acetyl-gamma-glutamyl-phosphate reductase